MKKPLGRSKQQGYILSSEFMMFATIMVLGLMVGWVTMRDAFNAELIDTANAIESSITFYYFNDPDRNPATPGFVEDTLEFHGESTFEGEFDPNNPPVGSPTGTVTPETAGSPTGSVTAVQ